MKNNTNNLNQDPLNEQQLNDLENDAVWSLLDSAEKDSPSEASPMFARNVMREIRVNHLEAPVSFWQRLTAPKFNKIALSLGAAAACAALVVTQIPNQNSESITGNTTSSDAGIGDELNDISLEDITTFVETEEDIFTDEMLDLASQDPFYISEEEIEIAMQM